MRDIDMRLQLLKNSSGLSDEQTEDVGKAIINNLAEVLNKAKVLIEKKADPEVIRHMMGTHGVSYDGKAKKFI